MRQNVIVQFRPYQAEAKQAILSEWASGHQKTLLVLPTGNGKAALWFKSAAYQP